MAICVGGGGSKISANLSDCSGARVEDRVWARGHLSNLAAKVPNVAFTSEKNKYWAGMGYR